MNTLEDIVAVTRITLAALLLASAPAWGQQDGAHGWGYAFPYADGPRPGSRCAEMSANGWCMEWEVPAPELSYAPMPSTVPFCGSWITGACRPPLGNMTPAERELDHAAFLCAEHELETSVGPKPAFKGHWASDCPRVMDQWQAGEDARQQREREAQEEQDWQWFKKFVDAIK